MSHNYFALDDIERLIYKNGDDLAVTLARSLERLEERVDAAEARLFSRLNAIEDKLDAATLRPPEYSAD